MMKNDSFDNPVGLGGFVPTLLDICLSRVKDNIDNIKQIDRINDVLLLRVFEKCSPVQLFSLEAKLTNRKIDTSELWRKHCNTSYNIYKCEGSLSWKSMYSKLEKEYQDKKNRIGQVLRSHYSEKENEKKSKQIKVIDMPNTRVKTINNRPMATRNYSSSSSSSSSLSGPRLSSPKSSMSKPNTTGKLMAKVLKEHRRK